jgi:plasmid stabilization system protein ParE
MSYEIVLRAKAERAIQRAAAWYRNRNPVAAMAFLMAVRRSIQKIAANPAMYHIVERDLRRAIVKGFPYSILFRMDEAEVLITNCVHFSRHPRHWRT